MGAGGRVGGSTQNRGLRGGGATTMPTTPSEVKSTYGRTRARSVSPPPWPSTAVITPTGTPGTNGRCFTDAAVTSCWPTCSDAALVSICRVSRPDPPWLRPVPVT